MTFQLRMFSQVYLSLTKFYQVYQVYQVVRGVGGLLIFLSFSLLCLSKIVQNLFHIQIHWPFCWSYSFDYLHTISDGMIVRVFNLFLSGNQITDITTRLILLGNQITDIVSWSWCSYWYLWLAQVIFEVRSFPKYVTLWWSE